MNKRFRAFGINYDDVTMAEAIEKIEEFVRQGTPRMFFTTGAELVVRANRDNELKNIYLSAHLITIDSYVVYFAARLLKKQVREPVNAANLMFRFLKEKSAKGYRLFFLGGKEEILSQAVKRLRDRYPAINIAGWHHGYFNLNDDLGVVNEIVKARPDIIFVGMSSPLKEKFISKNLKKMGVPVAIGVGGSIDVAAGYCRLAPGWVSRVGLEWLYRFIQEPGRLWKRYLTTNPAFIWLMLKEFFTGPKRKDYA